MSNDEPTIQEHLDLLERMDSMTVTGKYLKEAQARIEKLEGALKSIVLEEAAGCSSDVLSEFIIEIQAIARSALTIEVIQ